MQEYIEKGLIKVRKHPKYELFIYNYTDICQYERAWDEVTIKTRGLILDGSNNLVAKSFPKFFNYEELLEINKIPEGEFIMEEKLDGSLGILFNYNGEWIFATRGSFEGDIAERFRFIFKSKYSFDYLDLEKTYIFEIISPINRIVVGYDYEDIILLAVFKKEVELGIANEGGYFRTPKNYIGYTFNDYKKLNTPNEEGVVVKFKNGERMKIKFETYIEIHRRISNISVKSILTDITERKPFEEIIFGMPDEWFKFIEEIYVKLISEEAQIEIDCILNYNQYKDIESQKDFALAIQNNPLKSYLFLLRKGIGIEQVIFENMKKNLKEEQCKTVL